MFVNRYGEPYRCSGEIRKQFQAAARQAVIKGKGPYAARHTFASWLTMRGESASTVMALGGWKRVEMLKRYAHLDDEHKRKAVEELVEAREAPETPIEFHNSAQRKRSGSGGKKE